MKFLSTSEKQTFNLAKKFSKNLTGGQVLGLIGNLSAGKTVFAKGLAQGLGIKKNITSPTFILMKVYPVKSFRRSERNSAKSGVISRGKLRIKFLIHLDAYRIKSIEDLISIGANEYFNRPDTITVIEWADKIKKILPKKTKFVKISINKTSRIINY
jgi:tRNA threonylcarbamoyladenosine biosynthesis protein TsaE